MKFFFCGGSNLIWGFIKEENRFPNIISKHFNAEPTIVGLNGGSNKRTIRKVFYEYDMNEYDLIVIDFTPENRTEFYNDRTKKWERYHSGLLHPNKIKRSNHLIDFNKRMELYYQTFYNSEYGRLQESIDFTTIKKYLTALNRPHIMMSSKAKKSRYVNVPYDYHLSDYEVTLDEGHLTKKGHQNIADDIIKRYENIL